MNNRALWRTAGHARVTIRNLAVVGLVLQAFATVAFAQPSEPLSSSYTFTTIDIPTPGGQFGFTSLTDISKKGKIMGGFTDSNLGPFGFRLNDKHKPTEIRCDDDVLATAPQSINKRGEIAGFASVVIDRIPIPEPPFEILITKLSGFFRDKKGRCTILDFPGATLTEASGVNDDGNVVGDYSDAGGSSHGFTWHNGVFATFDVPFSDATSTAPTATNNVGQIVGFYFDNTQTEAFPNGRAHGFLYDTGVLTSFDFPDATATFPSDINDRGQIVGIYADADSVAHSFLLDNGNVSTFVVPFPDAVATEVSGINNNGQIVGRYLTVNPGDPFNPFLSHGFVATPIKDKSKSLVSLSTRRTSK
jgi:probable HAF family extracellular repeat protein